ncbi:hypothetical protein AB0K64_31495 [Streptomyces sp. NPDC053741]|uniref:Uncharacterized protein n=1 Tax=Streptomyces pratensis (strain ATCC 33331 / IAF-45CD) TaxID=591167 RepID=A0A8D3WRA4_STRFA|nr:MULTISPECIES: hypothetical protein [Streptomyces]MBD2830960.1 hypothetical protein [Streptomyces pratensis]MYT54462.1 hypothetical protein [Streptomyces sp. SID7815]MYT57625.1 hypothetical protein [Streptomyces sp. SID7834]QBR05111.1 hypothetical protein D7Y56_03730 [Streptomyces sp. S501]RAS22920.1 hypothetical protein BCL80_1184 [Streptomyces avidinii]TPM95823.1 hypothetical protein FKO01_52795 [Mesorhizobium sp. B2-3-3]SNX75810.1 hypothetical protein SAMN05421860_10239 [Streptomyces mi
MKAHDFCTPVTPAHYSCGTSQSWVYEKRGETYPFVLRIDKAVECATGKISFAGEGPGPSTGTRPTTPPRW